MSISQVMANAYDPTRWGQTRSAAKAPDPASPAPDASARRQIGPISITGLNVFDAAQARILGKMDTDGDGGLTAAELSAGFSKGQAPGAIDPAYFAAMDKDSDGKLQLGELQASSIFGMNTLNALLSAQEDAGAAKPSGRFEASDIGAWLVSQGDQDGDGVLSAEEFASVGPSGDYAAPQNAAASGSAILSKSGRAFAEGDVDKDGRLTGEELAHLMETGPHRLTIGDATRLTPTLMRVADSDGDESLSIEEARATAKSSKGVEAMFQQGDTDHDGKLSAAELKTMIDAKPGFYGQGLLKLNEDAVEGHTALRGLLLASLDRIGEAFRAQFDPPRTETKA